MKKSIANLLCAAMFLGGTTFLSACGDEITEIKVLTPPDKTVYLAGEYFDKSGMEVVAVRKNGTTEEIFDYTIEEEGSPLDLKTWNIHISYGDLKTQTSIDMIHRGNAEEYSLSKTEVLGQTALTGKTFYWLGSSVTFGASSMQEGMGEFIAKRNGGVCVKEAVSGTPLANVRKNSYVERIVNLPAASPDAFICQLSTNDTALNDFGSISKSTSIGDFNTETTFGAIEYIIAYARQKWDCPILFYTNSYYENAKYPTLVENLHKIAEKWDIAVLDLYTDTAFNDISDELYDLYMYDSIHPTRAGYREWWVPAFESSLAKLLK